MFGGERIPLLPVQRPSVLRARLGQPARAGRRGDAGGQAMVEFALVIAVMLVMALAVFDLASGFYNSLLLTQAARDGARVAMDCNADVASIRSAALAAAPPSSSVSVAPDPRPVCTSTNSTITNTTVTVTYTHQWIIPFWSGWDLGSNRPATPWGTITMIGRATSR